jgi:predicted ArsR family transcriptional regulator
MAIVQTLDKYSFVEAFEQSSRKDQFSHEALEAIFDYLEEYSDSTGEPVELDIIAICCDWTEADWKTIAEDYKIDLEGCDDDEERIEAVRDYLEYETQCVELSEGSFVYVNF